MIKKIGVEDNINSSILAAQKSKDYKNPNFKGGAWALALQGLQECEKNPMINVAVVDMVTAILPRTYIESKTNWFAGFEAFRRESSGLIINCMTPGVIAIGLASLFNRFVVPKGAKMSSCFADSTLLERLSKSYESSTANNKAADVLRDLLENIEGFDGRKQDAINFKKALSEAEINEYVNKLTELTKNDTNVFKLKKEVQKITKDIAKKTHVYENISINGTEGLKATNTTSLMQDAIKFLREYGKAQKNNPNLKITEFAESSKKLVRAKSIAGLAVVLPLAASMQYINRWITEKVSGTKGAPIYDDFGTNTIDDTHKKDGLLKQKLISISSMLGVGLLSMMKMPSWNMFEFKGLFPTMDQARIISTTTFASRMAAADDKNELAEATVRDIATFCSLYFLGDYAAKAAASVIEKYNKDIILLNDTKPLKGNENALQKFWHWFKNLNLKSSEEVVSKTAEDLKAKGLKPTQEQEKIIEKELKKAVNLRSACQVANLGVSLLLLGLIIPIFTRQNTKKKHAEAIKIAQNNSSGTNVNSINTNGTNTDVSNKNEVRNAAQV